MKKSILGGFLAVPVAAFAAVPAGVTTAMTDMGADALAVGVTFLVALIGIKGLHLMRRA